MADEGEFRGPRYTSPEALHREQFGKIDTEIFELEESLQMIKSEHSHLPEDVAARLVNEKEVRIAELRKKKINFSTRNIERDK